MQKIKILHIIKSLGRGGAEVLLPETLSLHDKGQFDFYYVFFLSWKNQMVGEIKSEGGKVKCFPSKNNIELLLQHHKVKRFCQDNNIDLIHCHLPWSGFLGRLLYRSTDIPVVYTEHNIQEKYHYVTRFLNKITFNAQTIALGVSKDVSTSIRSNINPKIPVRTLLNGVNTEKFRKKPASGDIIRKKFLIPENAIILGNVAVFRDQKNIPLWLKTFKNISSDNPLVFGLLVGTGPQEKEVKELIRKLGLEERVFLPGQQTNTLPYFSSMDIFMMSSDFEGLPIALLEAMSAECAIVSTEAGGVKEVIRDGQDGLLCPKGNIRELTNQCVKLIENPELRKEFQVAARLRVKQNFSLYQMVESLESIYLEVKNNEL